MVLDARDTVGPVAGRPRQGAGRAWVEGGAARTRSLGTRNRRGTVGRHPQGAPEWRKGSVLQQPEKSFQWGISCLLGSPPRKGTSGNDSPRQELLAGVGDLVWESRGP